MPLIINLVILHINVLPDFFDSISLQNTLELSHKVVLYEYLSICNRNRMLRSIRIVNFPIYIIDPKPEFEAFPPLGNIVHYVFLKASYQ